MTKTHQQYLHPTYCIFPMQLCHFGIFILISFHFIKSFFSLRCRCGTFRLYSVCCTKMYIEQRASAHRERALSFGVQVRTDAEMPTHHNFFSFVLFLACRWHRTEDDLSGINNKNFRNKNMRLKNKNIIFFLLLLRYF